MKTIYTTSEWKGYGKQNYYHNEYRQEDDTVYKVKCNNFKTFDGHENNWVKEETVLDSWNVNDERMPGWLRDYI